MERHIIKNTPENSGEGDNIKTSFDKVNLNFEYLFDNPATGDAIDLSDLTLTNITPGSLDTVVESIDEELGKKVNSDDIDSLIVPYTAGTGLEVEDNEFSISSFYQNRISKGVEAESNYHMIGGFAARKSFFLRGNMPIEGAGLSNSLILLPTALSTYKVYGANSVALGSEVYTKGVDSVSIGSNSEALGNSSVSIGKDSVTQYEDSVALGSDSNAGSRATALGHLSNAAGSNSLAIGSFSNSTGNQSLAISSSFASGRWSIAAGVEAVATAESSLAIGKAAEATEKENTAIGQQALATGIKSVAMGSSVWVDSPIAVAVGVDSSASAMGAVAVGSIANANGRNSLALGYNVSANSMQEINMGSFGTIVSGNPNSFVEGDRLFNIGGGTSTSNRKDVLTILKSGLTTLPGQSIANIDSNPKAVVTKEYIDEKVGGLIAARYRKSYTTEFDGRFVFDEEEFNEGLNAASASNSLYIQETGYYEIDALLISPTANVAFSVEISLGSNIFGGSYSPGVGLKVISASSGVIHLNAGSYLRVDVKFAGAAGDNEATVSVKKVG